MIKKLSVAEIALMRHSGKILFEVKTKLKTMIKPGVTTLELDEIAEVEILRQGGKPAFKGYQGFKHTICASVNAALIHGVPSRTKLNDGDLLKIDLGVIYEGFYSDSAFSVSVGSPTPENTKLILAAERAFAAGVAAMRTGNRLGDIEAAIGQTIKKDGFFAAHDYAGHGVNDKLHAEPLVRNEGKAKTGPKLFNGMVIAIEPMLLQTSGATFVAPDGWTVIARDGLKTAHFEETVALIDDQAVILTGGENG